jgi:multiple sugar transport system substrate-binding protein
MRNRPIRAFAGAAMTAAVLGLAACGGGGEDSGGGATAATDFESKLSKKPVTLSFLWFEWPPAQALEALGKEYSKTRPNVTVKVNTVPIANWHDAIFTQFAAQKTNFDMPILDSQYIGEAVENGNIVDLIEFAKKHVDETAYDPYFLAAYGQYPQTKTGEPSPDSKTYGLPLMGDTWSMIYRKDLIDKAPETWDEMISAAKRCQDENPGMSGLAFHQANATDAAAVTYNTVNGVYGGELWNPEEKQIKGVVDNAAGKKAMDVLVNQMKPLTPKGSGNWFIDEVTASINQGKVCIGMQWIGGMAGLMDPESSQLGKTKEEILEKLAFSPLPKQDTDFVPLGGMGMHISKYAPADRQAEALNFMKWFQQPEVQKKWAELGGVPGRKDALASKEFLDAAPVQQGLHGLRAAVARLLEPARVHEAREHPDDERQRGAQRHEGAGAALDEIATEQQAILDESE